MVECDKSTHLPLPFYDPGMVVFQHHSVPTSVPTVPKYESSSVLSLSLYLLPSQMMNRTTNLESEGCNLYPWSSGSSVEKGFWRTFKNAVPARE